MPGDAGGRHSRPWSSTSWSVRHVAGTLNAQAGATLKEAMRRPGHSSRDAALRKQHAVDERDAEIADAVGDLIGRSSNGTGRDHARSAHASGTENPAGGGDPPQ